MIIVDWKTLSEDEGESTEREKEESNDSWIFLLIVIGSILLFGDQIFNSTLNLFLIIAIGIGFIYFFWDSEINLPDLAEMPLLAIGVIAVSMIFIVFASLFFFVFSIVHVIIMIGIIIIAVVIYYEVRILEFILIAAAIIIFIIVFTTVDLSFQANLFEAVGFFGFDETLSYIWSIRIGIASFLLSIIFTIIAILNRKNKYQENYLRIATGLIIVTFVCLAIMILLQTDFTTI